jgi:phage tail-like protein
MANPAQETVVYPFTAFNFTVEIEVPGVTNQACAGAFSECDGLEMTMDVKTIREGGNNTSQIRMVGAVNYGQVTLKRGMTSSFDLWDWFDAQQHGTPTQLRRDLRGDVEVVVLAADHKTELVRFILNKCLLTKLTAPALNAKDGVVGIEEMQLTYESMNLKRPGGGA